MSEETKPKRSPKAARPRAIRIDEHDRFTEAFRAFQVASNRAHQNPDEAAAKMAEAQAAMVELLEQVRGLR